MVKAFQRKSALNVYNPTRRVMAGNNSPRFIDAAHGRSYPKHISYGEVSLCRPNPATPIPHGPRTKGSRCEGWKLMHRQGRPTFDPGDAVLDRLLHLLEGAHLDLAHALA
jgi:hypothetical protein